MILAIQKSALPEEMPDLAIFSKNRIPNWKTRFRNFLGKEGAYNFAKMAMQIKNSSDEFCMDKYGKTSSEVFEICEIVWFNGVTTREGIEATIRKIKSNHNYTIQSDVRVPQKV